MSEARGAHSVLKRRLLGVGFVVLVLALIALSVAGQQHAFRDVVTVQMKTDKVGNQLAVKSDVKARGVFVGQVADITPTADGATLDLELTPEYAAQIPKDVTARIMPKTLFGERYVQLSFPTTDGPKMAEGDVITQDRSSAALELAQSFEKLLPVLRAVQPHKLNSTLTAISTALDGRGEELGDTLVEVGELVQDLNPEVPKLKENLQELAKFADTIEEVAPDLIQTLDNFRTTSKTLVDKQRNLQQLFTRLNIASQDLEMFLAANRDNLITVNKINKETLALVAKYSPEIPCVTTQMADALPVIDDAMGIGTKTPGLRAKVVIGPAQNKYEPGQDEPDFGGIGTDELGIYKGPWCLDASHPDLPEVLPLPYRFLRFNDGSDPSGEPDPKSPELDGKGLPCDAVNVFGNSVPAGWLDECMPGTRPKNLAGTSGGGGGSTASDEPVRTDVVNNPAENKLLGMLVSLETGMAPDAMPSWGSLLVGPLYRGAEVEIR